MNVQEQIQKNLPDLDWEPTITVSDSEILVKWETNNDGHPTITFHLHDTGDDTDKAYDLDITVSNNDNVGPIDMLAQLQWCMQKFYDMGLNTRFGHIVGDFN